MVTKMLIHLIYLKLGQRQKSDSFVRTLFNQARCDILVLNNHVSDSATEHCLQRYGMPFKVFYAEKGADATVNERIPVAGFVVQVAVETVMVTGVVHGEAEGL